MTSPVADILSRFPLGSLPDSPVSAQLHRLCTTAEWSAEDIAEVDALSKGLDIRKELYPAAKTSPNPALQELALALYHRALTQETDTTKRLKRFNALFKGMDIFPATWLAEGSPLRNELESAWNALLSSLPQQPSPTVDAPSMPPAGEGRTLPITVLFYEGPIARAYLETLRHAGYRPQKIIHLIAAKDIATKKPVASWLPENWRKKYAASVQRSKIHHWPRHIARRYPALLDGILHQLNSALAFPPEVVRAANALSPLGDYADTIETLLVDNLSDPLLRNHLEEEPASAILYTGGGIVPRSLLTLPQLRFLHIHPGFLPEIRGADCTLWSSLLTGHASASCFYMDPGIDTGDIILPCWLPQLTLPAAESLPSTMRYRTVYSYIDPWVRAFVLRALLSRQQDDFMHLPSTPQTEEGGTTFHFMHERLKEAALAEYFR